MDNKALFKFVRKYVKDNGLGKVDNFDKFIVTLPNTKIGSVRIGQRFYTYEVGIAPESRMIRFFNLEGDR